MRRLQMTIRLYLLYLLCTNTAFGTDLMDELTVRDVSLGSIIIGTGSPLSPAGRSEDSDLISMAYRNKFSMKEMAVASLCAAYQSAHLDHAIAILSTGYEDYRQTLVGIHTRKKLSSRLSMGVTLRHYSVSAITLENALWCLSPSLGMEYILPTGVVIGASADGLASVGSERANSPNRALKITAGVSYRFQDQVLLASSYERIPISGDGCLRLATEYTLVPEFQIRVGIISQPFSPVFGIGYTYRSWTMDLASEQHRYLGSSVSIALSYHFRK